MNTSRHSSGFSLIELMIAVTLGMLAVAAVGSVFIYGSRNYKQDDKLSRMQDELRYAMAQLTTDLEMAGFWAQINNPPVDIEIDSSANSISISLDTDCGPTINSAVSDHTNNWVFKEFRAAIATRGNATSSPYALSGSDATLAFPCITSADFQPDTDIIAVKHLGDATTAANPPENGKIYLRTNGVQSTIYKHSATPPEPTGVNVTVFPYLVTVWYVRKFTIDGENPRIPALCRAVLLGDASGTSTNPNMQGDPSGGACVAQGIEDMQLEFGLDSATTPDGVADIFTEISTVTGATAADRAALMARVVAVRVHLLARSSQSDAASGYKNEKSYTLASKPIPAKNDGFYRKTLSTIVLLRNPANRLNPFSLPNS